MSAHSVRVCGCRMSAEGDEDGWRGSMSATRQRCSSSQPSRWHRLFSARAGAPWPPRPGCISVRWSTDWLMTLRGSTQRSDTGTGTQCKANPPGPGPGRRGRVGAPLSCPIILSCLPPFVPRRVDSAAEARRRVVWCRGAVGGVRRTRSCSDWQSQAKPEDERAWTAWTACDVIANFE